MLLYIILIVHICLYIQDCFCSQDMQYISLPSLSKDVLMLPGVQVHEKCLHEGD